MTPFKEKIRRAIEDYVGPSMAQDMIVEAAAQVAIEEIASAYQDGWLARNNDEPMDTKEYLQSIGITEKDKV